jgi:nucleotide-binding universal stress UspA family protein
MKSGLARQISTGTALRLAELRRSTTVEPTDMVDPAPYKTVAVATTFSPRFREVLAEAKRIAARLSADLHLVYVGERGEETAAKFRGALAELQLPSDATIHYQEGDPAKAILRAIAEANIDVIVAGALEKEVVLHPFLGNVARHLVRDAPCSVVLFTKPQIQPRPLRRIVFVADYSNRGLEALKRTLPLAAAENAERLYVIRIITTFDRVRESIGTRGSDKKKRNGEDEEEDALERFVLSAGATEVPIETRCIRGNTGLAAADFVQSVEADLLVVPLKARADASEQLPKNIAWITDVIPCNLWVIR